MGVPKFYRWLSERYPCLSEVVKEQQIPEFDNLYLDMNGIIHICSHPNDDDVHFRISEEKIISDIFHYIEVLFRMIQPRKTFFMAIDGVAPRAKMNQQRGRRFRSAKEAELNERRAKDRGEELPKEARFDSNCITPGTSFMHRLQQHLTYFVTNKISTDALWEGVKVILSGHETPGEGEHKIMDFIRHERSKLDYDPNTRHCLYGLDADLMMLGMCTHDPHFSLLREEVRFNGKKNSQKRVTTPEETTFHLLHLSLLREYLELEFSSLVKTLPFPFDVEAIIDDWILLGFLVGNDFLPHLPHLHINKGALSELFDVYKEELPKLGGYINNRGTLHLKRFEQFLAALSIREMDRFEEIYSDNKWLEGKTAKRTSAQSQNKQKRLQPFQTVITDTPGPASVEEILMSPKGDKRETRIDNSKPAASAHQDDLLRLINSVDQYLGPDDLENEDVSVPGEECDRPSTWDNQYHIEFRQYKREYYVQKLGYAQVTPAVLQEQAEVYVHAIQWNLHYYYNGCKSWSWFYPHHFAPWISDIKGFSNMDMTFDMGEPFLPFEQLLSVLPAASKELLPKCYQILMTSESSPIIDYYPVDFETDLNGKQQEWEAIVLIPFIQEEKLKSAMAPYKQMLTEEEKSRNRHGPMLIFEFTHEEQGTVSSYQFFPPISKNKAKKTEVWREEWEVPESRLRKGLIPEVRLDVFFPGFPTLKHIPHTARLDMAAVRVFEQASRGLNMILSIQNEEPKPIESILSECLGKEVWVSWPHMIEAKVINVIDESFCYSAGQSSIEGKIDVKRTKHDEKLFKFEKVAADIADNYKNRWGVKIGKTKIILQAQVLSGRKYVCGLQGKITLEKQWSKSVQSFALQATRKDILVHDPSFTQYRTLPELYPPGSTCFSLMNSFYGAQGVVKEILPKNNGKITVVLTEYEDVDLSQMATRSLDNTQHYFQSYVAAKQLGIKSYLFSRITGTMFVLRGPREADQEYSSKVNIGLNLKINKKNEEVSGFTKRGDDNNWLYSMKTVMAVKSYMSSFPEIFDFLDNPNNLRSDSIFHHSDIFQEGNGDTRLRELADWMAKQPFSSAARQSCGTLALDESIVLKIEQLVEKAKTKSSRTVTTVHASPYLIYKPNVVKGGSPPDPETTFVLFDRVVNIRLGFSVPLGMRGTITGILKGSRAEEDIIEVLFDSEFSGGLCLRSSSPRSYRLPGSALINVTYGKRLYGHKNDTMKTLWPQVPIQGKSKFAPASLPVKFEKSNEISVQPPDPKELPDPMALFQKNHPNPEPPIRQGHDNRLAHFEQDGRKIQGLKDGSSFKHHEKKGRVHSKRNESDQKKSGLENSQISDNGQQLEQQLKSMLNINSETSGSKKITILKRPPQQSAEPSIDGNIRPKPAISTAQFVPLQVHKKQSVKKGDVTNQIPIKAVEVQKSLDKEVDLCLNNTKQDKPWQPETNGVPRKIELAVKFPSQKNPNSTSDN